MELNQSTLLTKLNYGNKDVAEINKNLVAGTAVSAPTKDMTPSAPVPVQPPPIQAGQPAAPQAPQVPQAPQDLSGKLNANAEILPVLPSNLPFKFPQLQCVTTFPYKKQVLLAMMLFVGFLFSGHPLGEKVTAFVPESFRKIALYLLITVCVVAAYSMVG